MTGRLEIAFMTLAAAILAAGCGSHVGGRLDPQDGQVVLEVNLFGGFAHAGDRLPRPLFEPQAEIHYSAQGSLFADADHRYKLTAQARVDGALRGTDSVGFVATLAQLAWDFGSRNESRGEHVLIVETTDCDAISNQTGAVAPCDTFASQEHSFAFVVAGPQR